jgi:AcrB/AcrD/AcrF family
MIGIVKLALRRPYTFVVMALLIMIFGVASALRTPTDIFPNINIPVISVVFSYTGLPPDDMAGRIVTFYERSLTTSVNDIEHIESQSIRVLIVTTSDARIDTMLRTQRHFVPTCPPGFFLYSTPHRLHQHGALGPAWVTLKRDNVSLLGNAHILRESETVTPILRNDTAPSLRAAGVKRAQSYILSARA